MSDNAWLYQTYSAEQAPRIAEALNNVQAWSAELKKEISAPLSLDNTMSKEQRASAILATFKKFGKLLDQTLPDGRNKDDALRALRLGMMAAIEVLAAMLHIDARVSQRTLKVDEMKEWERTGELLSDFAGHQLHCVQAYAKMALIDDIAASATSKP